MHAGGRSERPDHIRLVRDRTSGIEAGEARFGGHAYDLRRHDDWLVGVTDRGMQDYFCRGARRRSTFGWVILIEPGVHRPATAPAARAFQAAPPTSGRRRPAVRRAGNLNGV